MFGFRYAKNFFPCKWTIPRTRAVTGRIVNYYAWYIWFILCSLPHIITCSPECPKVRFIQPSSLSVTVLYNTLIPEPAKQTFFKSLEVPRSKICMGSNPNSWYMFESRCSPPHTVLQKFPISERRYVFQNGIVFLPKLRSPVMMFIMYSKSKFFQGFCNMFSFHRRPNVSRIVTSSVVHVFLRAQW